MKHFIKNHSNLCSKFLGLTKQKKIIYFIAITQRMLCMATMLGLLVFTSCSNNDDNNDGNQQTNLQLLTSGKWYNESKTPGSFTACEKKGYIKFETNGNMSIESFDDGSGTCQTLGVDVATYTLTDDVNITITFGSEVINAVIISITETLFTVNSNGETTVFDKTEG